MTELWNPPYDPSDPDSRDAYLEVVADAYEEWEDAHLASAPFDPATSRALPGYNLHHLDHEATSAQNADLDRRVSEKWLAHRLSVAATAAVKHAQHRQKDHGRRYEALWIPGTPGEEAGVEKYFDKAGLTPGLIIANTEKVLKRATPESVAEGKIWYPKARDGEAARNSRELEIPMMQSIGILAATSQQAEWWDKGPDWRKGPMNSHQATARFLSEIATGHRGKTLDVPRDAAQALYDKAMSSSKPHIREKAFKAWDYNGIDTSRHGENFVGRKIPINELPADVLGIFHPDGKGMYDVRTRAIRMARGDHPDDVLAGSKIRSFYNNMYDQSDPRSVTLDRHQVRISVGDVLLPDDIAGKHIGNPARYEWMAKPIRQMATSMDLYPAQIQAISWVQWRKDHPRRKA